MSWLIRGRIELCSWGRTAVEEARDSAPWTPSNFSYGSWSGPLWWEKSAIHAGELVHGIGWAAFWIYWLVPTLISRRNRLANAAKHPDDDQLGALVCLVALIDFCNGLSGVTINPQVTTHPVSGGLSCSPSHVRRSLLAPQAE